MTATSENDPQFATECGIGVVQTHGRCWAMLRELVSSLHVLHGQVVRFSADDVAAARQQSSSSRPAGTVAVVPLKGVITPQMSLMSLLMGGGDGLNAFMSRMQQAMADPDVKAVVMNVDSPGGLVDGVPEAAAQLRSMRAQKPLVAVANTQAASAAYWLASQAHEVIVTPSGEVGSVGVYSLHEDVSAALEQAGIKPTLVSAGKFKVEGNPYEPLGQEAFDAAKQAVDDFYALFTADVAGGRGQELDPQQVTDGTAFSGGRMLTANRAVKAGIADRVATLGETIGRLQSGRARVRQTDAGAFELAYDGDDKISAEADDRSTGAASLSPEERLGLLDVLASR